MSQALSGPALNTTPRRTSPGNAGDAVFEGVARGCGILVLVLLGAIIVTLFIGGLPALKAFGPGFLTNDDWDPVNQVFGGKVAIFGTVVTSILALAMAIPIAFGIAFFLTELAPRWVRRPVGIAVELLAAVPSIIYGMWGFFVVVPFMATYVEPPLSDTLGDVPLIGFLFAGAPFGTGILTASIILAIMVIPFIAATMRDVFLTVPAVFKESAYGLGCTTWEVMRSIVLPYTRVSVVGGIMLGLGRALGETMAVTFVIGNTNRITTSLFGLGNTIASLVALEFPESPAGSLKLSALLLLGFILFVISFIVLAVSRLLLRPRPIRATAAAAPPARAAPHTPVTPAQALAAIQPSTVPEPVAAPVTASAAATLAQPARNDVTARRLGGRRKLSDHVVRALCWAATAIGLFFLASILVTLVVYGASGLSLHVFTRVMLPTGSDGGLANAIVGSLIQTAIGTLIGTPIGLMVGTYLSEYAAGSKLGDAVRFVSDILLSAPSILVGLFCYQLVVLPFGGFSGWAGCVALAILVIPIVVRTTEDMLRLIPTALREAAVALGAPKWRSIVTVCYPAALDGLLTGILLAIARIAGETAPLLFTSLGNLNWSFSLNHEMSSLPIAIYQDASSSYDDIRTLAWVGALIVTVGVLAINIAARTALRKRS